MKDWKPIFPGSNSGGWSVVCLRKRWRWDPRQDAPGDGNTGLVQLPAGRCSSVSVSMRRQEQVNLQTIIPLKEDQS